MPLDRAAALGKGRAGGLLRCAFPARVCEGSGNACAVTQAQRAHLTSPRLEGFPGRCPGWRRGRR